MRPSKYPVIASEELWKTTTTKYSDGRIENRSTGQPGTDQKQIAEDLYNISIAMGFDPEAKRFLKLKRQLLLKQTLKDIADVLRELAKE